MGCSKHFQTCGPSSPKTRRHLRKSEVPSAHAACSRGVRSGRHSSGAALARSGRGPFFPSKG
eukprot:10244279-Lingulodinium_polyedra.AAC.1